jgi:hypothetical protein
LFFRYIYFVPCCDVLVRLCSLKRKAEPATLTPAKALKASAESPSLVLVINDTKLLMPCVKCFELGISNTCDEGVCGKEWWPQDHKEMVHGHEMMIMVEMHII